MSALKLRDMQSICRAIGSNFAKTKLLFASEMATTLKSHTANVDRNNRRTRVLSIDMGVRNLAYCLLEIDSKVLYPGSVSLASNVEDLIKILDNRPPQMLQNATILQWKRLSLQPAGSVNAAEPSEQHNSAETKTEFKVPEYAIAASRLVLDTFVAMQPSHVIIERQRHRSGGHSSVLEWTFRVNMLEAMLYGSLFSARELARSDRYNSLNSSAVKDLLLWPIPPSRMSAYWGHQADRAAERVMQSSTADATGLEDSQTPAPEQLKNGAEIKQYEESASLAHAAVKETEAKKVSKKEDSHNVKLERILLADTWLSDMLQVDDGAQETLSSFRRLSTGNVKAKAEKRDDLADCLLQGIAHLCWQANTSELSQQPLFTEAIKEELAKAGPEKSQVHDGEDETTKRPTGKVRSKRTQRSSKKEA